MLRSLLLLFFLWPITGVAQQGVTLDAFGFHIKESVSSARENWAGFVLRDGVPDRVAPANETQLYFFFGEKSQVAGNGKGHAVAIGVDQYGNLIADGSPVDFKAGTAAETSTTLDGIADIVFPAGSQSGVFDALSKTPLVQSSRRVFRVLPDISTAAVELPSPELSVAAQSLAAIETNAIADAFGNALTDGVSLSVIGRGDNQSYSVGTAQVFGSKALASILTRDIANLNELQIGLGTASQQVLHLSVPKLRLSAPPRVSIAPIKELGVLQLSVDPLRTTLDQLLPDGTPIAVTIRDNLGQKSQSRYWVKNGGIQALLAHSQSAKSFDVTVSTPDEEYSLNIVKGEPVDLATRVQSQ